MCHSPLDLGNNLGSIFIIRHILEHKKCFFDWIILMALKLVKNCYGFFYIGSTPGPSKHLYVHILFVSACTGWETILVYSRLPHLISNRLYSPKDFRATWPIYSLLGQKSNGLMTSLCVRRVPVALRSQNVLKICFCSSNFACHFLGYGHYAQEM